MQNIWTNIWKDLRYAVRQLRRNPGFALTAILTLALGIGANTAIFSLLDQALLRALPVSDPASLVVFRDTGTFWNGSISMSGGDQADYFSYPQYLALRDQGHDLAGLLATSTSQVGFTRNGVAQFVNAEVVSGNYFQLLGVEPALGRLLLASDDTQPGANPVAVLSYDFWRSKLGSDPSVVGSNVTVSGHTFQIIGVSAPRFTSAVWGQSTGIFIPMSMLEEAIPQAGNRFTDHHYRWLSILGRLKPGISIAQATADNAPLWHAFRENDAVLLGSTSANFRKNFLSSQLQILPGSRGFNFNRSSLEKPFLAVMAMAVLVLLIASVNVASLLMVRSAGRMREFSLRAALGASPGRVVSQLLLEGTVIGLSGGAVGVLLAPFALRVLIGRLADQDGQTTFVDTIDHRVLLFNFGVAVAVSLLFSLLPALQSRRPNLTSTLRESTGTGASGLQLLRRIVVCLQIGLSVVLLVGAGLFIRTMQQLRAVDVGFNTTHLLTFNIDPERSGYTSDQTPIVQQRILDGLATIPGIKAVAAGDDQALVQSGSFFGISVTGYQKPPDESYQVQGTTVTPNYMTTMQIPLIAGRAFTEDDNKDHPSVALVNQEFVRHYCGGVLYSCIGRRINYGKGDSAVEMEIVGVFRNYRNRGIKTDIPATFFRPLKQNPQASSINLYLRTTLDPRQAIGSVINQMHRLDPNLAVGTILTMDQQIDIDLQNERIITLLAISFGALATILAGVGLYGVLAYSTTQRTREIGIRMALGSSRTAVSALILRDVLGLAALGVVIAVPVAYGLSIIIRSELFGVSAADPAILLAVVAIIAVVAFLSGFFPARRAASVSPTEALRTE
jgi:putative ABC transport system permease protein